MNSNHGRDGRFVSSGAADGDPTKESAATRRVPGAGPSGSTVHVPRHQVTTRHAGVPSVGVTRSAREEKIAMGRAVDERRFPTRSDADVAAKTDLSKPTPRYSTRQPRFPYQN